MPEFESDPFFIDQNFVAGLIADLRESQHGPNQRLARYLEDAPANSDPEVIGMLGLSIRDVGIIRPLTHDAVPDPDWYTRPIKWAVNFIKQILAELREIICGPKKKSKDLSPATHAVIASIAAVLVKKFHLDPTSATGVAVLILITIARATKRAFCKMTDEDVLRALEQKS